MASSLKNPQLKLGRAKEHLDILDTELVKFQNLKPFRVSYYENPEHTLYVMRCEIPIIDLRLAIIASDAIYSLRASLDYLAWQLALITKERPFDRTEFPIVGEKTAKNIERFNHITKDIPPNAVNEIKMLQPYHRGASYKSDLLWELDKLCNISKHRIIPAEGTALDMKIPSSVKASDLIFQRLDDAYIVAMPIAVKTQMQFAPPPTSDIVIGSKIDGLSVSVRELGKIYNYIRDTVFPRFTCFFSE